MGRYKISYLRDIIEDLKKVNTITYNEEALIRYYIRDYSFLINLSVSSNGISEKKKRLRARETALLAELENVLKEKNIESKEEVERRLEEAVNQIEEYEKTLEFQSYV